MKSRISCFCFGTLAILVAAFSLHSCTKADVTFGDQWINNGYTQVTLVDTITPQVSTIYLDTFPTNGTGYGMIGVYKDPAFGTVSASTYMQLQPPAITQSIIDSLSAATFDSAVVFLKLRNNEYGDTTQNMTVNVYQLTRNINYYDNTTNLYNTTSFPVNSTPIGSKTLRFGPNPGLFPGGDTLTIRLNDALGADMLNKLKTFSYIMQNSANFLNYFMGLKIAATAPNNNGFIFNTQDSATIRIYYKLPGATQRIQQYSEFTLNNNAYQFNNISIDRTGTVLDPQNIGYRNRSVPTSSTNNIAYLQQSTQTAVKLMFPTVKTITYQSNYLRLVKAILTVQPVLNSYYPFYTLPASMYIGPTADYSNTYTESTGTAAAPYQDPTSGSYSYTYDITSYITTTELTSDNLTGRGLILFLPASAYKSRVNRVLIGDAQRQLIQNNGLKLQLYYISVQ